MIIGNGDIAKVLPDRDDLIFFASGVSNSKEVRSGEFRRERDLLFSQDTDKRLVYFGSLSIFYSCTPYAIHKKRMEDCVKTWPKWTIIRLGNICWGTNPHTIINYLCNKKARDEEFEIQDAFRYIVGQNEFLYWIDMIPDFNCEMNVPGRRMTVQEIVDEYVK